MNFLRRTWAEIDLDNALFNWQQIKRIADSRYIMPVVKADAYGHGANILAKLYEENGAYGFAVSNINEAIKLRKFGIKKDILVLGFTPIKYINQMYAFNITQCVYCKEYAEQLSVAAATNNFVIKAHLKLDTGMSRIGFDARTNSLNSIDEIEECLKLPNINYEGIFTHFSSADSIEAEDVEYSDLQYSRFTKTVDILKAKGHSFKFIHCCNSAASALRSSDNGNLIRPGIILYGSSPSNGLDLKFEQQNVMSVKSAVSMVKTINAGDSISYGRTFTAEKDMTVATVPIGYADGYPRAMSNRGFVIINGQKAPIVGRVCMDQLTVDVSDIKNVQIGTVVTVIGNDGKYSVTFDDIAEISNTISYEIMCNVSIRMPRVYIKNSKTVEVVYLGGTL
ncbi:MAG: alanine racemase [Clostridia bacterium]|nr:alanine racemase [Clostridia bacterium]